MKNKLGLSRYIPADVKRAVRQRCGFGCVLCGAGIYHYDHFQPEFEDATKHCPEGITLLCGSHHDEKSRGWLTSNQIADADAAPFCIQHGQAFGTIRITGATPTIRIGCIRFEECRLPIRLFGEKLIWFEKPNDTGEGVWLNALIRDQCGEVILEIQRNEWVVGSDSWDVETQGPTISVKSKPYASKLKLKLCPPDSVEILSACIVHRGMKMEIQEEHVRCQDVEQQGKVWTGTLSGRLAIRGAEIGLDFRHGGGLKLGAMFSRLRRQLISTTTLTPLPRVKALERTDRQISHLFC